MAGSAPEPIDVRGGVAGVSASLEELLVLAGAYDSAAWTLGVWAAEGARILVDPDLLASAPLSPLSLARAEADVLAATMAPDGLAGEVLGWETDAIALRVLVAHLRATDDLVASGMGLLGTAVLSAPDWLPRVADLAGRLYPDGDARTRPVPLSVPAGATAPRGVGDLVTHLQQLSRLSGPGHPEHNGTIAVQTLSAPDGSVRHVLLLPGTDDMTTRPWTRDGDVRDMGVNLELAAGAPDDYTRGVLDALAQAGVGPDEPVLVAGHSQGGTAAARLLEGAADHGYALTHAVVLGAPVAAVGGYPTGARLLALEQRGDVVPLLDGGPNPDSRQQVTVGFDSGVHGVQERHSFSAYAAGAALVDASTHPSVLEQVGSMQEAGFLAAPEGTEVTSRVFQVVREP